MSTHKYIDRLCCAALALTLAVTALFMGGESLGIQVVSSGLGYENRLFAGGQVHTIDIVMDDWEGFLDTCENEEYTPCALVIDGEAYRNVGIRAKGNTSLSSVAAYGNDRYSFKVEFDHYDSTRSYYGLDKLSLNNLIQDNTCMKDFLCYQLMGAFGVAAPLCSYVSITVNGEAWGLYLAVEGVEDAFLRRNYGNDAGELYKPDSTSLGGGRGNGGGFDLEELGESPFQAAPDLPEGSTAPDSAPDFQRGGRSQNPGHAQAGTEFMPPEGMDLPQEREGGGFGGGRDNMGGMGSSDVKLQYVDDDPSSYPNIFDNAKTSVTDADKARLIDALKTLAGEDAASALDVEQVLRYFVVHGFVCNGDSYTGNLVHNYYLYEEDGRLSMIPWDYNLAFGGFQSSSAEATVNEPIDTPVTAGSLEDRPMVAWIFRSEEYTELYHQYYAQFIETLFNSGFCQTLIEDTRALIAPYVEQDPTKFCTYEAFESGVEALQAFCTLRAESVRGQLAGTIPSTSQGQAADSTALVDASGLTLSDMGSMMGGGMFGGQGNRPQEDGTRPQEGAAQAFAPSQREDGQRRGFQPPGGSGIPEEQARVSRGAWLPIAASAAVLLAGLAAVRGCRRPLAAKKRRTRDKT